MSHEIDIRCDAGELEGDQREQLLAWVRSLGLNPADYRAGFLITRFGGVYQLHLSRFLRGENGGTRVDRVTDEIASEPVVVDLDEQTWPSFLGRWAA